MTPNRIQTTPQSPTHSGPFRYVPPIRGFRFDAPHNITPNGHSPVNPQDPHVFHAPDADSDEGSNEENGEENDEGIDEEGADEDEEEEGGIEEGMCHSRVPIAPLFSRPPRGIHHASRA